MNKVLVTGNLGYIGSVLTDILVEKGYEVSGYDIGYFQETNFTENKFKIHQKIKDIRDIEIQDVYGYDFIIHLAAISNDPLGELSPGITEEINYDSTIKLAKFAKEAGVKRFVYASSQSLYGIANSKIGLDEDKSEKNPITAYAKTKWYSELELKKLNDKNFTIIIYRPSTVFGASPRIRCDIVFNNFLANAYTTKKIIIKSNGEPYRPAIHIQDVCHAFLSGIKAPIELVANEAFNVGFKEGNYSVLELANFAKKIVIGSEIEIKNETGNDERTYIVSFDKILNRLKNFYIPKWNLENGGQEIINFFDNVNFSLKHLDSWQTNRLKQIKRLQNLKKIDNNLRINGI